MQVEQFDNFREGKSNILVSTDVASRGLDFSKIDHVIMFDFPSNLIDYIHRAGRTGRMGSKGSVTSLLTKKDLELANAIETSIKRRVPLEGLSADSQINKSNFVERPPHVARTSKPRRDGFKSRPSASIAANKAKRIPRRNKDNSK